MHTCLVDGRLFLFSDDPQGKKDMDVITPSQALQIAGRSGRFGTTHEEKGYVTTFMAEDIELMHELLGRTIDPIQQAGLHPTAEQVNIATTLLAKYTQNHKLG